MKYHIDLRVYAEPDDIDVEEVIDKSSASEAMAEAREKTEKAHPDQDVEIIRCYPVHEE